MMTKTLPWLLALLLFIAVPARAEMRDTNTNWKPVMIMIFPLDNKSPATPGHSEIRYIVFPSGFVRIEQNTFYVNGDHPMHEAWLSEARYDAILALAKGIVASKAMTKHPAESVQFDGSFTGNKLVSRDCRRNVEDVQAILRLLGGIWPDIEPPLPPPTLNHP